MKIGIMCGFKLLLWILLVTVLNARHVPLARQRNSAQSRPRLLVIRPPEGSGQPNRIVVLANQRPQPTNASPTLSTAISALQETAAVAQANLNRAFGGHPQSAFRHQTSSSSLSSSSSSSSSTSNSGTSGSSTSTSTGNGGTRSIRNLIQGLRRAAPTSSSNIARVSDTIPRAMPPVLPPATRFGELNIPSVIEAALRRLQERARLQGNVRDNNVLHRHEFRPSHTTPKQTERAPFSGGVIDLSRVSINDRNNRNDVTSGGTGRTNTNPRWDIGTVLSTSTLGRNGVSPLENVWDQSGVGTTVKEVGTGFNANDILQMPADKRSMPSSSVGRTGSNLRTFQDKSLDALGSQTNGISAAPTLDIQTLLSDSLTQTNPVLPSQGSQGIGTDLQLDVNNHRGGASFQIGNQPPSPQSSFDSMIPAPSRIDQFLPPSPPVTNQINVMANAKNNSLPTPVLSLNASAKVSASSAESNSTSNTTSTKSVKTKTIKVTTVVKGGNQADVAAAAASQAELANAVAQGKEINSSALAGLAKAAAGVKSPKINPKNNPPAGSITVKRQPNGDSIITLSDGQGEPVILRASGPVKIERIIKPNGRIQFLINPVEKATTTTIATPETTAELEIEPEDITTTVSAPTAAGISLLGFTNAPWTTEPPFYSDTVPGKTNAAQGVKEAKVEKTIQITDTAVSNSASSAVNTSVKNETSSAHIQQDLMKLFKPPGIPRPPKVSDMNFGNAGLSDPFLNGISSILRAHAKNVPPPSDVSMVGNVHTSTTTLSALPTDKNITPLNLFPGAVDRKLLQSQSKHTTVVTETMPQYNLLGVSPSLTFVPKGKSGP